MTTYYGINATKYYNMITVPTTGMADFITEQWNDNVKMVHDEYTVPVGDIAAGSIVTLGRVPKGSRVLYHIITYAAAGAAATGTIKVGSTTSAAVTSMVSAGSQVLGSLIASSGTPTTADANVTLTTADQTVDAAVNITLTTFYIPDGIGA